MATPVVESITPTVFSADATAHLVNMPATVNAGELLLVLCGWNANNAGTITTATPSGWAEKADFGNSGHCALAVYVIDAVGDDGGTQVDFVTSGAEKGVVRVYRISGWHSDLAGIEVSDGATGGASTNPNPAALNLSGWAVEDTLWVAVESNKNVNEVSAAPADYTSLQTAATSGGSAGSNVALGSAVRGLAAALEDPGEFSISTQRQWCALTIAIRSSSSYSPRMPTFIAPVASASPALSL